MVGGCVPNGRHVALTARQGQENIIIINRQT